MIRLPESPRARERLYRRAAVAAVALVVAILLIFFRNTGHSFQTPLTNQPADVFHLPKPVPASPADRAAAERTLDRFVRTAVIRRNPGAAWELATEHMKEGSTRAEWEHGVLPVVPYPAAEFRTAAYTLRYSYRGRLGYDILVLPKSAKGEQRVYSSELREVRGRWLVELCYPRTTL